MTNLGKMNNCPIFLGRNCCKKVDFQFVNKCPEMLQFISEGPIVVLTEIFPKNIDSRDIFSHELKLQGYDILMGKVELNSRGVCIQVKHGLSYQEC